MAIQLSPEQRLVVGQAIHAGLIRIPDDVVWVGVETIRQRLEARNAADTKLSAEEWRRELHAWIQSNPTTMPLLSDEAIRSKSYTQKEMEKLLPLAENAKDAVDLWGAMRGTVTVAPGVDLTERVGEVWDAEL